MDDHSHDHDEMPLNDNMAWGEDCAMATDQSFGTDQLWDQRQCSVRSRKAL